MDLKRSLALLRIEAIITSASISMPAMNPFFESIGLSQAQIGFSQAIYTAALLMLNIPTGWLADRFSRKMCNLLGNVITALGFLAYPFATSFIQVVFIEVIIGIGCACTSGADVGLLRAYCELLKREYHKETTIIAFWRPIFSMLCAAAGGVIAATAPKLAMGLTSIPFLVGAFISLHIREEGEHLHATGNEGVFVRIKEAVESMYKVTVYALHGHKDLAWSILAMAVALQMSHALTWLLTPLLLLAGVSPVLVGVGWALGYLAQSLGSWLSWRIGSTMNESRAFILPALCMLSVMILLSINISIWTVGFYVVIRLAEGWYTASMAPLVQRHAPSEMQATVFSVGTSIGQLLYIGSVSIVNLVGDTELQWAILTNALLFMPLVVLIGFKLRARR